MDQLCQLHIAGYIFSQTLDGAVGSSSTSAGVCLEDNPHLSFSCGDIGSMGLAIPDSWNVREVLKKYQKLYFDQKGGGGGGGQRKKQLANFIFYFPTNNEYSI